MIVKAMLTAAGLYLLLSPVRVEAQTSPAGYNAKWAIVDSLAGKAGLPQSALKEINGIYTLARQEHNDGQQIKALVYRIVAALHSRCGRSCRAWRPALTCIISS